MKPYVNSIVILIHIQFTFHEVLVTSNLVMANFMGFKLGNSEIFMNFSSVVIAGFMDFFIQFKGYNSCTTKASLRNLTCISML